MEGRQKRSLLLLMLLEQLQGQSQLKPARARKNIFAVQICLLPWLWLCYCCCYCLFVCVVPSSSVSALGVPPHCRCPSSIALACGYEPPRSRLSDESGHCWCGLMTLMRADWSFVRSPVRNLPLDSGSDLLGTVDAIYPCLRAKHSLPYLSGCRWSAVSLADMIACILFGLKVSRYAQARSPCHGWQVICELCN